MFNWNLLRAVDQSKNEWKETAGENPTQFLIYDNGPEAQNRILVFGSEVGLRHLDSAYNTWFMDGNYAMAQPGFKQRYTSFARLLKTPQFQLCMVLYKGEVSISLCHTVELAVMRAVEKSHGREKLLLSPYAGYMAENSRSLLLPTVPCSKEVKMCVFFKYVIRKHT